MKLTVNFHDLLKYGDLAAEVIFAVKHVKNLAEGGEAELQKVIFDVGDERYELGPTPIRRTR